MIQHDLIGENCKKCGKPMFRQKRGEVTERTLAKEYYFTEWDICTNCNHIQHYEKYKVKKDNPVEHVL